MFNYKRFSHSEDIVQTFIKIGTFAVTMTLNTAIQSNLLQDTLAYDNLPVN